MKRQWLLSVLCAGLGMSSLAQADLKVLFKFDDTGVVADQVIEITDSGENYPASLAEVPADTAQNMVIMTWVDSGGQALAISRVSDPRVARSPEHMNPALRSRVGLSGGAWIGSGPDNAETVIVEFPDNSALGLQAETWSVSLRQDE